MRGEMSIATAQALRAINAALDDRLVIPYLGPGVLALAGEDCPLPDSSHALVGRLTASSSVPHKIRNNLTATAQFIENFKHRRTLGKAMTEAFRNDTQPTALHRFLATLPTVPLIVHAWYDDLPQKALADRSGWGTWGMVQGVSQSERSGCWAHYLQADGTPVTGELPNLSAGGIAPAAAPDEVDGWETLLYQPLGSVSPAANFLVSDTDFVEVLTEIDIQTPIPEPVQRLRTGRHFLFLGCRFAEQLDRLFARQIMKRSSDHHWAVLPESPTRNEERFLAQQNIERIELPLAEFVAALAETRWDETAERLLESC